MAVEVGGSVDGGHAVAGGDGSRGLDQDAVGDLRRWIQSAHELVVIKLTHYVLELSDPFDFWLGAFHCNVLVAFR